MSGAQSLAGGYILFTGPEGMLAVSREHLERWVLCSDYPSLPTMLRTYSANNLPELANSAERAGALAFSYRPGLVLPELCRGASLLAFADFLSGKLQAGGYAEASEYLGTFL